MAVVPMRNKAGSPHQKKYIKQYYVKAYEIDGQEAKY